MVLVPRSHPVYIQSISGPYPVRTRVVSRSQLGFCTPKHGALPPPAPSNPNSPTNPPTHGHQDLRPQGLSISCTCTGLHWSVLQLTRACPFRSPNCLLLRAEYGRESRLQQPGRSRKPLNSKHELVYQYGEVSTSKADFYSHGGFLRKPSLAVPGLGAWLRHTSLRARQHLPCAFATVP